MQSMNLVKVGFGVLLICFSAGCHRDRERAKEQPIDVTALVPQCASVAECEAQCASDRPASCVAAGRLYEYGRGVPADAARAYRLYAQACDKGYAGGCYNAALSLEAGKGVARDPDKARALYQKVCEMGSKTACARAEEVE